MAAKIHVYVRGGSAADSGAFLCHGTDHNTSTIGMLDPYKETCPRSLAVISRRLMEHCLPFFIDPKAPSVTLRDEIDFIDLNKTFAETFAAGATDHTFQVKDHMFRMRGLRLYSPYENLHRLMYAANSREVRTEKIDKVIPNLQSRLTDTIGPFVYLGFIEGDYLDKTANGERTDFSIPSGDDDDIRCGQHQMMFPTNNRICGLSTNGWPTMATWLQTCPSTRPMSLAMSPYRGRILCCSTGP